MKKNWDLPGYSESPEYTKKCTKCGEIKNVPDDFSMRRNKRKRDGGVSVLPAPECKECKRKLSAAWRAQRRSEGKLKDDMKRWNEGRDKEAQRKYHREYAAIRRRKRGCKVVGPWKKYRETPRSDSIPMEPLAEFVSNATQNFDISYEYIAKRAGVDSRRLRSLAKPTDQTRITSDFAERVIKAVDSDIHLSEVYPELYSD